MDDELERLTGILSSARAAKLALLAALRQVDAPLAQALSQALSAHASACAVVDAALLTGEASVAAERATRQAERRSAMLQEMVFLLKNVMANLNGIEPIVPGSHNRAALLWAAENRVLAEAEEQILRECVVEVLAGPPAKGS